MKMIAFLHNYWDIEKIAAALFHFGEDCDKPSLTEAGRKFVLLLYRVFGLPGYVCRLM